MNTEYQDNMEGVLQAAEDMIDGFIKEHVVEMTPDPVVPCVWRVQTFSNDYIIYLGRNGKNNDFEEIDE